MPGPQAAAIFPKQLPPNKYTPKGAGVIFVNRHSAWFFGRMAACGSFKKQNRVEGGGKPPSSHTTVHAGPHTAVPKG
ncbi:hypothetical protein J21TS3_52000 [Paenibacillus cookii]|uniref:Uncharacterized protein n=1 Tax=Paenibacillus cookii TaxID=157839 RepID=A0ABQ4M4L6_9BACL|nr:hypothetical protein J21TS3_52000 [Paenibacillus cookii]